MSTLRSRAAAALGVTLAVGLLIAEPADARRGGSFGSRGSRTYSAPARTRTSPGYTAPVQRSMTPGGSYNGGSYSGGSYSGGSYSGGYAPRQGYGYGSAYGAQPGAFRSGGFGRGLIGGLVAGGLIGGLLGHGFGGGWGGYGGGWGAGYGGGGAGFIGGLLQLLVLFFLGSLLWRWFRSRRSQQAASPGFASPFPAAGAARAAYDPGVSYGAGGYGGSAVPPTPAPGWEIPITAEDQAEFESLLRILQDAFAREDYGRLRDITTPEVMSYLAEELSENATHGRRNEVTGTRLIQADVGEAWNESGVDYATAAMRYESIDIMRDRATGAVLSGDPSRPTATTELWTFTRRPGQGWKVSAIQDTGA